MQGHPLQGNKTSVSKRVNTMHPVKFFLAACFSLLLHLPPAFAIQRENLPTPSDLALEIPDVNGQPSYWDVPAVTGIVLARYEFKRIKNWQRSPDQPADPSAFQLQCSREGDAIKIDLSIIFGLIEKSRTLPTEGLQGQLIGSYSARLGESLSLQELARFGIEPIKVKIVASNTRDVDPSQIQNKTKSLQVVRAETTRDYYSLLELRNISSKSIIALNLSHQMVWSEVGPLIAPGRSLTTGFLRPESGWPEQRDQPPGTPARLLPFSNVVFEDLTFEGERDFAIQIAVWRRGARIQVPRVVSLLQAAIEELQQDSQRALYNLRQRVSSLSYEPESPVIDDLARRLMPLTELQRDNLIRELRSKLKFIHDSVLATIEHYVEEEVTKGTSRESWLRLLRDNYAKR